MKQASISDFVNNQIEVAVNIERVRLAEKFISEKQTGFEMQYAIDLLYQALCGFEKLIRSHKEEKEIAFQDTELDISWLEAK